MTVAVKDKAAELPQAQELNTPAFTGNICVIWHPESDFDHMPKGYGKFPATRPQTFCIANVVEGKTIFENITLRIGANWVDSESWERLKAQEAKNLKSVFFARINCDAIIEIQPNKTGVLEGNLHDYSQDNAKKIVKEFYGIEELELLLQAENRPELTSMISSRIAKLKSGEIR
jgi:hypothetical protein